MFRILGEILGYNVGSICAVIANRAEGEWVDKQDFINSINNAIKAALEGMVWIVKT